MRLIGLFCTRTWTLVSCMKGKYVNHLHHMGFFLSVEHPLLYIHYIHISSSKFQSNHIPIPIFYSHPLFIILHHLLHYFISCHTSTYLIKLYYTTTQPNFMQLLTFPHCSKNISSHPHYHTMSQLSLCPLCYNFIIHTNTVTNVYSVIKNIIYFNSMNPFKSFNLFMSGMH